MRCISCLLLVSPLLCSAYGFHGGAGFAAPSRPAVSTAQPRVARAVVMQGGDYYSRLGVQRNADEKEIKNVRSSLARAALDVRAPAFPRWRFLTLDASAACRRRHTGKRRGSGTRT